MKLGWLVVIAHVGLGLGGSRGGLFRGGRASGKKVTFGNPGVPQLMNQGDSEQSLGNSTLKGLIDCLGFERHGDGRRFISAGIVELAVVQNGDGDQSGLAAGRELEKA